jgi:hypothetical protein
LQEPSGPSCGAFEKLRGSLHCFLKCNHLIDDAERRCKKRIHTRMIANRPSESERRFPVPTRERRDARWSFTFECLCIETSFAGDHQVARCDSLIKSHRIRNDIETGADACIAKGQQAEA